MVPSVYMPITDGDESLRVFCLTCAKGQRVNDMSDPIKCFRSNGGRNEKPVNYRGRRIRSVGAGIGGSTVMRLWRQARPYRIKQKFKAFQFGRKGHRIDRQIDRGACL